MRTEEKKVTREANTCPRNDPTGIGTTVEVETEQVLVLVLEIIVLP